MKEVANPLSEGANASIESQIADTIDAISRQVRSTVTERVQLILQVFDQARGACSWRSWLNCPDDKSNDQAQTESHHD